MKAAVKLFLGKDTRSRSLKFESYTAPLQCQCCCSPYMLDIPIPSGPPVGFRMGQRLAASGGDWCSVLLVAGSREPVESRQAGCWVDESCVICKLHLTSCWGRKG